LQGDDAAACDSTAEVAERRGGRKVDENAIGEAVIGWRQPDGERSPTSAPAALFLVVLSVNLVRRRSRRRRRKSAPSEGST
jgi:hypothetical protein